MPYFMRKERDKYCVFKGTSDDPGELVKCHDDENKASAHLRALLANVDDAKIPDKVPHKTPKKGVDLPAQAKTGPADWETMKAEDIMKAVGKGDELVAELVTDDNQEKDSPDTEKALSIDGYSERIRNSFYRRFRDSTDIMMQPVREDFWVREVFPSYVVVEKDNESFRVPYSSDSEGNATFAEENLWTKVEQEWVESKSLDDQFIVYKSGDTHRWLAISNVAIQDKEFETLTDKSYDDAIAIGKSLGYGELDLVHVPSTDVGDCDLMLRLGEGDEAKLVEGGPWHNTSLATRARKSVQSDPSYWGVSIKFVYDPAQFVDGVYHGGIRIKKRTILPRHMAASYGTAIAVLGGDQQMKELDQETRDALSKLGVEEKEIETLAEQSKSLPDEPNTRTKESESFLDQVKTLIANALGKNQSVAPEQETAKPDVAEQSKTTETEVSPAATDTASSQEPTETNKESDVETPVEKPTIASEEVVKAIAETVAQSLAPSIQQAVQPLSDALTTIKTWQDAIEKRLIEAEKDVETRTIEKLEAQPPVVKITTTELKQAETDDQPTTILDSPAENYGKEFMEAVQGIVASALKGKLDMPEIKLSE